MIFSNPSPSNHSRVLRERNVSHTLQNTKLASRIACVCVTWELEWRRAFDHDHVTHHMIIMMHTLPTNEAYAS